MHEDILDRLQIDPGRRKLGELLQEREAAAHEVARLRAQIERLTAARATRAAKSENGYAPLPMQQGMLIRLNEVAELLGVARSTIYKWVNQGTFPSPVRINERAVRWRTEDIERWRSALVQTG